MMSAGESDSESDMGEGMVEVEEFPETPYVHSPEEEFGAVNKRSVFVCKAVKFTHALVLGR